MSKMIQPVTFPAGCELTPTGMILPPGLTFEQWEGITELLTQARRRRKMELIALDWALADALNYGEREYGEKYAQAVTITGLAEQTLMNICWTAEQIPPGRRRPGLSFAHHAEVAALPAPDADALLDMAEMQRPHVTAKDLRTLAQDHRMRESGKDPIEERARRALANAVVALTNLPRSQRAQMIVKRLIMPLADVAALERKQFLVGLANGICEIE